MSTRNVSTSRLAICIPEAAERVPPSVLDGPANGCFDRKDIGRRDDVIEVAREPEAASAGKVRAGHSAYTDYMRTRYSFTTIPLGSISLKWVQEAILQCMRARADK